MISPTLGVSFTITGAQLRSLLSGLLDRPPRKSGGFSLQFSGIELRWRQGADGPEIESLTVGGTAIAPDQTLHMATNSYIAEQWEHHLKFEPHDVEQHGFTVREAAQQQFADGPIAVSVDPRLIRVD